MPTTTLPASIRHRNPGAMGLGKSAKLFGATKNTTLADGNTIATFPTSVDGAGAMFHLLRSSSYLGLSIWSALHKWGDGQALEDKGRKAEGKARTDGYAAAIEARSSFSRYDRISADWLENPDKAIDFGKAMAWHEAGGEYPMTADQWREAHDEFLTAMRGGVVLVDRAKPDPVTAPLELLITHIGEKRVSGPGDNDFIADALFQISGRRMADDTAHCAAVLSLMLKLTGYAYLQGDEGLGARNYMHYGHALDEPEVGCIAVFWRVSPKSWEGHVAFVESFTATTLTIVGANQRDPQTGETGKVCRVTVPRTGPKSQVLGYRRPVLAVRPATEVLADESIQRKAVGGLGALTALIWSAWGAISGAVSTVAHVGGEMVGLLPDTAAHVGTTVSAGQQLSEAAGVPWPIQLGLLITVCSLAFGAYSTWKRLRPNKGALTRPPYETDPVADDANTEDFFSANVISPETEKRPASVTVTVNGGALSNEAAAALVKTLGHSVTHKGVPPGVGGGDGGSFDLQLLGAGKGGAGSATEKSKPKPKRKARKTTARKPSKKRAA